MKVQILATLSVLACAVSGSSGFYQKDKNIYEATPLNFDNVVLKTNYTSIVEFYAPWCGYCKQLEPIYHKLARYFQDDANYAINVVSVNCDEAKNKPLCSRFKIQGFPSIQVFRPPKFQRNGKTLGKHIPEVYNGPRELPAMVEFVSSRLKNYVKKFHHVTSQSFADWLNVDDGLEKVVVLTSSDNVSALLKSVAIDFLDTLSVASVTIKTPKLNLSITHGEDEIEITFLENDTLPVLLVYKKDEKKFIRYKGKKLRSMAKIQRFIMDTAGVVPSEGEFSKRGKKLRKYRGISKSIEDEL